MTEKTCPAGYEAWHVAKRCVLKAVNRKQRAGSPQRPGRTSAGGSGYTGRLVASHDALSCGQHQRYSFIQFSTFRRLSCDAVPGGVIQ